MDGWMDGRTDGGMDGWMDHHRVLHCGHRSNYHRHLVPPHHHRHHVLISDLIR